MDDDFKAEPGHKWRRWRRILFLLLIFFGMVFLVVTSGCFGSGSSSNVNQELFRPILTTTTTITSKIFEDVRVLGEKIVVKPVVSSVTKPLISARPPSIIKLAPQKINNVFTAIPSPATLVVVTSTNPIDTVTTTALVVGGGASAINDSLISAPVIPASIIVPPVLFFLDTIPPLAPILDLIFFAEVFTSTNFILITGMASTDTVVVSPWFALHYDNGLLPNQTPVIMASTSKWNHMAILEEGYNYFRYTASDRVFNTSSFSGTAVIVRDTEAPSTPIVSVINDPLSLLISLNLVSSDNLSSRIFFDLEYSTSSEGVWNVYVTSSSNSIVDFIGQPGEIYYFRARASDNLGNISGWSWKIDPVSVFASATSYVAAPVLDNIFLNTIYTSSSAVSIFGKNSVGTVQIAPYRAETLVGTREQLSPMASVSGTDWIVAEALNDGNNYFYFVAYDFEGNTSTFSSVSAWVFDTVAPPVPTIAIINEKSVMRVTLIGADELSSTSYTLAYRSSTIGMWIDWAVTTSTAIFEIPGERGVIYYFRALAQDGVGNLSDWSAVSTSTISRWSREVIINEIAWAGTSNNFSGDEWIELYNQTSEAVNLANWQILVNGLPLGVVSRSNTIIPAHGYYLFEKNREGSVQNVTSDVIYNTALSDTGAKLQIKNALGEIIDEVDCSSGWFGGTSSNPRRSMERLSPLIEGNIASNWQSNQGPRAIPKTFSNGSYIYGSPKAINFGDIVIDGSQTEVVRILRKEDNPYWLGYYTISPGLSLETGPGVVVKSNFDYSTIEVYGSLSVSGTLEQPVVFTSGRDTDVVVSAQAVIGSWIDGVVPAAKDWQGIWFRNGSQGILSGLNFRYAGKDFQVNNFIYTGYVSQGIRIDNSSVTISKSIFKDAGNVQIHAELSTVDINNTTFTGGDRAIEAYNTSLSVDASKFSGFNNILGPLMIRNRWPILTNNIFSGNALDAPYLTAVTLTQNTILDPGTKLHLDGFVIPSGKILTVSEGSTLYIGPYNTIEVSGSLFINGTPGSHVTIDAVNSTDLWGNISFISSSSSLNYVDISHGNRLSSVTPATDGMVLAKDSTVSFNNVVFSDARSPGNTVQGLNSNLSFVDCTLNRTSLAGSTIGFKMIDGTAVLNNTAFANFSIGISGRGSVDFVNTTMSQFSNVGTNYIGVTVQNPPTP